MWGSVYRVRSAAVYVGEMRRAILGLKYGARIDLGASLGRYLDRQADRLFPENGFDRIVPVPLHPKRTRERGFNQCILLARPLARTRGIFLDDRSVKRIRHTHTQTGSQKVERRGNLRGAFRVQSPSCIKSKSVLVVDDVYTTGTTMESLAQALLAAGARHVSGITLARSLPPSPFPRQEGHEDPPVGRSGPP